jgi:hypothetical protein
MAAHTYNSGGEAEAGGSLECKSSRPPCETKQYSTSKKKSMNGNCHRETINLCHSPTSNQTARIQ